MILLYVKFIKGVMMDRRKFLKTAGVGAVAASVFTTNLYARTTKTLKICLSWPKTLPIMGVNMLWFADRVKELSGGSLKVKIFGANELVPALGVFDACSKGLIDGFHAGPYYWKGKNIAFALPEEKINNDAVNKAVINAKLDSLIKT